MDFKRKIEHENHVTACIAPAFFRPKETQKKNLGTNKIGMKKYIYINKSYGQEKIKHFVIVFRAQQNVKIENENGGGKFAFANRNAVL